MATATNSQKTAKTQEFIPNATTPDQPVDNQTQGDTATDSGLSLEDCLSMADAYLESIQAALTQSLGHEWKRAAIAHIKAIGDKQAKAYQLRDSLDAAEASDYESIIESLETVALEADTALQGAIAAKPSDSERAAANVLYGNGHLLISGEEYLIPSEGIAIVRYVRQAKAGQLSVLFIAPTQGEALIPVGLITADNVKRFSDVRLTPDIQKAIMAAKGKWCEAFKQAVKADKLAQKEQAVRDRFASAGFTRI